MAEKEWKNNRWELDGKPYTYRVTWTTYGAGRESTHQKDFTDIDQGYDYYEMTRLQIGTSNVMWDHIPPA